MLLSILLVHSYTEHSIAWLNYNLFNHSPIDGHWGCYCFLMILNNNTISICVCEFIQMHVFLSLR